MELLERYLQAVRFVLPRAHQDDIIKELSEDLRSQIEEREAERGRPLGEDELELLLKQLGHPLLLALRYQPERYLIGPAVFPIYWFAVRVVMAILFVVHVVVPGVLLLFGQNLAGNLVQLVLRLFGVAAPPLVWITVAFVILDTRVVRSAVERSLANWNPRDLPSLAKEKKDKPASAYGLALTAVLGLWWLVGLHFPHLLIGPAAAQVGFGPIFYRLYTPMAAATVLRLAVSGLSLLRPHWTRFRRVGSLVVDAVGLVLLFLLGKGGPWFVATGETRLPEYEAIVEAVNLALAVGLPVGLVGAGAAFAWKCVKYARTVRHGSSVLPSRA